MFSCCSEEYGEITSKRDGYIPHDIKKLVVKQIVGESIILKWEKNAFGESEG